MKYCSQCGTQLPDDAIFCSGCGAKVGHSEDAQSSDSQRNRNTSFKNRKSYASDQENEKYTAEEEQDNYSSSRSQGIEIEAPEGATVTVSDALETVAPEAEGEFIGASWSEPKSDRPTGEKPTSNTTRRKPASASSWESQETRRPRPESTSKPRPESTSRPRSGNTTRRRSENTTRRRPENDTWQRPVDSARQRPEDTTRQRNSKPAEPAYVEDPEEQPGLFSRVWRIGKIVVLVISLLLSAFFVKDLFFNKESEPPKTQQQDNPTQRDQLSPQGDNPVAPSRGDEPTVPGGDEKSIFDEDQTDAPKGGGETTVFDEDRPDAPKGGGETTILGEEQPTTTDDPLSKSNGFQSLDELSSSEYAEYIEGLLERTEAELQEEMDKGSAGNQNKIKQLSKDIAKLRKALLEVRQ